MGLFNYLSARWVSLLVLQLFQLGDLLAISDQTIRFIVDCCCCLIISEFLLSLFPNTNVSAQDMEQWYSKPSEYNMRTERNRTFFFFMRWWMHFVFASSCWWWMAERFCSFGWHWQTQKKIQIKHQQSEQFVTIIIYTISS